MNGDVRLVAGQVKSVVGGWLTWWLTVLVGFVPMRLRVLLRLTPRYRLHWDGDEDLRVTERIGDRAVEQPRGLNRSCVIELGPSRVLRRTLKLPRAARGVIHNAIRLQLETLVPLRADQIEFDWVVRSDRERKSDLSIDLTLAKQTDIDRVISAAGQVGFEPICVVASPAGDDELQAILRRSPLVGRQRLVRRLSTAIVTAALLVFLSAVFDRYVELQSRLAEANLRVGELRGAAQDLMDRRDNALSKLNEATELTIVRLSRPTILSVMAQLTAVLPDDVWLDSLRLDGENLSMAGRAKSATGLIEMLEDEQSLQRVRFSNAITQDPSGELERFDVTATIVTSEEASQ